jgi:hypothetical protein
MEQGTNTAKLGNEFSGMVVQIEKPAVQTPSVAQTSTLHFQPGNYQDFRKCLYIWFLM